MKASYVIKHYRFAGLYRAVNKRWELKLSPGYHELDPWLLSQKTKGRKNHLFFNKRKQLQPIVREGLSSHKLLQFLLSLLCTSLTYLSYFFCNFCFCVASIENKTKQAKRTSQLLNSAPADCKYPAIVTALFVGPSSNLMFLALYPLHYRIGFPFLLPFAPKDPPSFTKKFEKSFMVLLLVPSVIAVELGINFFFICFHIQLPPPPPEKGVTDHVCNRDRKKCFKYFFFS